MLKNNLKKTQFLELQTAVYKIISDTLSIPCELIHDDLSYQSTIQWDSMGHINLVLALEKEFNFKADENKVLELSSVKKILNFISDAKIENSAKTVLPKIQKEINRGLSNVYFDESEISFIDSDHGNLLYRGYDIRDLTDNATYEDVAYLLIYKKLPTQKELDEFREKIASFRILSNDEIEVIKILSKKQSATAVLRTAISAVSETLIDLPFEDQGIAYISKIPLIIGSYFAYRNKKQLKIPSGDLSQAAYLLSILLEKIPDEKTIRNFEKTMILQAEHDANASAFSARVTISTEAELGNAVAAAAGAFSGYLHGGALLGVAEMLEEIQDESSVKKYISKRLQEKNPIYGFGHRVYRTEDPRAKILKLDAENYLKNSNNNSLKILEAIKNEMKEFIDHGVNVNVDFYACVSYLEMGLKKEMFVPVFISNRTCGWVAHIIEQKNKNILIRPRLHYFGDKDKKFIALNKRS